MNFRGHNLASIPFPYCSCATGIVLSFPSRRCWTYSEEGISVPGFGGLFCIGPCSILSTASTVPRFCNLCGFCSTSLWWHSVVPVSYPWTAATSFLFVGFIMNSMAPTVDSFSTSPLGSYTGVVPLLESFFQCPRKGFTRKWYQYGISLWKTFLDSSRNVLGRLKALVNISAIQWAIVTPLSNKT